MPMRRKAYKARQSIETTIAIGVSIGPDGGDVEKPTKLARALKRHLSLHSTPPVPGG
jgi:hypothetical protein